MVTLRWLAYKFRDIICREMTMILESMIGRVRAYYVHEGIRPCYAKRKKMWSSGHLFRACWPSSAEHSYLNFSHKGYQERSTCGSELMRFIPQGFATGMCCWPCPDLRGLEPRPLPTPAGQGQHRAITRTRNLVCRLGRRNEASILPVPVV